MTIQYPPVPVFPLSPFPLYFHFFYISFHSCQTYWFMSSLARCSRQPYLINTWASTYPNGYSSECFIACNSKRPIKPQKARTLRLELGLGQWQNGVTIIWYVLDSRNLVSENECSQLDLKNKSSNPGWTVTSSFRTLFHPQS